jgi:hypothetical protein
VGNFSLKENVSNSKAQTGQSIDYQIQIIGDGNISVIRLPEVKNDSTFDFFNLILTRLYRLKAVKLLAQNLLLFILFPNRLVTLQCQSISIGYFSIQLQLNMIR